MQTLSRVFPHGIVPRAVVISLSALEEIQRHVRFIGVTGCFVQ
jgi:hypothetical protein